MTLLALFFIRVYQWCIAPLIGNNCRYIPSCSNYAIQALEKFGFFKGSWLTLKRLFRCAPWGSGGHDPVP
jgi:uncharacterized protein